MSDPHFQIQLGAVGESKAEEEARKFRMFQFLRVQFVVSLRQACGTDFSGAGTLCGNK